MMTKLAPAPSSHGSPTFVDALQEPVRTKRDRALVAGTGRLAASFDQFQRAVSLYLVPTAFAVANRH